MEEDSGVLRDHEGAEDRGEAHAAPSDRVATWQDAFRAGAHVDQNLGDREAPKTGGEVEEEGLLGA